MFVKVYCYYFIATSGFFVCLLNRKQPLVSGSDLSVSKQKSRPPKNVGLFHFFRPLPQG